MARKWYDDEDDYEENQGRKHSLRELRRNARKSKEEKIWKSHEEKDDRRPTHLEPSSRGFYGSA